MRVFLRVLMDNYGAWMRTAEISDEIWGHREDGGPLTTNIKFYAYSCRRILDPKWKIETWHGVALRLIKA